MVQRYDASVNSAKLLVRPQTRPAPVDGFYQPTSSGRGQPIDVPAANSSGPSYPYPSYDPTRPVASASFHSAAGPLVPGHDRNRGRSNGSHYGRNGFSGSGSGHYALADDYGLSGEDMTSARFRQSGGRLEDRVGQYRSDFQRTHPQAGRPSLGSQAGSQGFAPAKDPANSPSQQQRRDQIKRKEESERVSFAERDAQSRELQRDQLLKRKEAREKGARESQSKPGGGAGASTAASARSAFKAPRRKPLADASGSANPKAGQVKVRPTDKGKGKVVHGAGSDGSAGEQEKCVARLLYLLHLASLTISRSAQPTQAKGEGQETPPAECYLLRPSRRIRRQRQRRSLVARIQVASARRPLRRAGRRTRCALSRGAAARRGGERDDLGRERGRL